LDFFAFVSVEIVTTEGVIPSATCSKARESSSASRVPGKAGSSSALATRGPVTAKPIQSPSAVSRFAELQMRSLGVSWVFEKKRLVIKFATD
jgi:hypothetical protein